MIPLLHDFSASTVLVFGGGPVGARKARRFAREARVVVVSPAFANESFESEGTGETELLRAAPAPEEVGDWLDRFEPALVVAATDDESVNDAVVAAARDRGTLVNRADRAGEREPGSVVVPATVREGDVVVSISTSGTAPVLSKHLRTELDAELAGAGEMATALAALRTRLKELDVPPDRRRQIVTDTVNSPSVWTALRTGAPNTEQVIEDVLEEHRNAGGELQ
ncbi:bifunctional precorrin-2 dehydrogenase/sirohydrochlorin ferrochelatase [Halobacteria archaeon AArc-dxtr1]|nr:bifunctional precorrin-2 dehydrogenase/sirohydrochlorin ferrochelatase [Halobacteria archaeon AArc-dxtr1]